MRRRPVLLALRFLLAGWLLTTCLVAGCGGPAADGASTTRDDGRITVLAAASLREVFATLARRFEREHPGTRVELSFGPSSGLATQILEGSPADAFAAASPQTMAQVSAARLTGSVRTFASNTMQIAVPPGNPARITDLADLGRPGVKVAVCQAAVPCGVISTTVLRRAGVRLTPVSQEADVKAVLTKVSLDEVDAGLVYVTDVRAAGGRVRGITIRPDVNASTSYPIATLKSSQNAAIAQAFVDLVCSPDGARVMAAAGFQPASS